MFKEELIKSLPELADVYEKWATEDEARADEILAAQDSYAYEVREFQLERASQLMDEAACLRKRASKLRELESGMHELVQDGYKVPQDRDHRCDGPQGVWRYKRFL